MEGESAGVTDGLTGFGEAEVALWRAYDTYASLAKETLVHNPSQQISVEETDLKATLQSHKMHKVTSAKFHSDSLAKPRTEVGYYF